MQRQAEKAKSNLLSLHHDAVDQNDRQMKRFFAILNHPECHPDIKELAWDAIQDEEEDVKTAKQMALALSNLVIRRTA